MDFMANLKKKSKGKKYVEIRFEASFLYNTMCRIRSLLLTCIDVNPGMEK